MNLKRSYTGSDAASLYSAHEAESNVVITL